MDFNPIDPANTSPRPDAPRSSDSAGFEHEPSALQALAEAPDYDQDRIWQEIAPAPSRAEPSRAAEASDFGSDSIWQHLEPELMRGGPSRPSPSQAGTVVVRGRWAGRTRKLRPAKRTSRQGVRATMTRDFAPRLSDF